jgi:hypothetical protein
MWLNLSESGGDEGGESQRCYLMVYAMPSHEFYLNQIVLNDL